MRSAERRQLRKGARRPDGRGHSLGGWAAAPGRRLRVRVLPEGLSHENRYY